MFEIRADGLIVGLSDALGIDLQRALKDPEFRHSVREMATGCSQHHCSVACAAALVDDRPVMEAPEFCPHRHFLKLLQEKCPIGKPVAYHDPFEHGRVHAAPISRVDDPSLDDRD